MIRKGLLNVLACTVAAAMIAALPAAAAETEKEAPSGGISISVTDGSEDAMDINTAKVATLAGMSVCRHLFEGLYKLDEKGDLVPGQLKETTARFWT